jgi:hypothetical protein
MRKPRTMTTDTNRAGEPATDTNTAGEPAALTDKELDVVTGGATPKLFEACADGVHAAGHPNWIDLQSNGWGSTWRP